MKKSMGQSDLRWALHKRLLELHTADPGHYSLPKVSAEEQEEFEAVYQRFLAHVYAYMDEKCSQEKIADPRFRAWFLRQNARNRFQSSIIRHMKGLYYIPVSFELSEGCSMGCNFCCLAAGKLKAVYRYTEEHAGVWRQVLEITGDVLGDIAGAGLCYFATEPFDNPDYEKFLADYRERFGCVPQTTTAAAQKDVGRTKRFLKSLGDEELSHAAVRFSVTTLEQLQEIYGSFTAEELYYVELLLNNPESGNCYSRSGRAIELSGSMEGKNFLDSASSACTNGFVVNMPKGTVMLVSVQRPGDRYPKGMRVLEEKKFQEPQEYKKALLEMIGRWMPEKMPLDCPLPLADHISYEWTGYRLRIQGDGIRRSITAGEKERDGLKMFLGEQAAVKDILQSVRMSEFEKIKFLDKVELFYRSGYLEENQIR